jgi:hypothetical protein
LALVFITLNCAWATTQDPADPATQKQEEVAKPELRSELLRRVEKDQKARMALLKWIRDTGQTPAKLDKESDHPQLEALRRIDHENTKRLQEIVEQSGWPGKSLVGEDGAHAAWLLLQHADHDPAFQKKGLKLMKRAPAGEVMLQDVAYLTDRVSMKESGKQVYGTQVQQVDGKWQPQPLVDPNAVDKLRAEAGLPPLAQYLEMVKKMYSAQSSKSDNQ